MNAEQLDKLQTERDKILFWMDHTPRPCNFTQHIRNQETIKKQWAQKTKRLREISKQIIQHNQSLSK